MTNKKGDVWVSAVLYIALGMVIITIVLAAGLPLVTKMKDKNTVTQTKRVMLSIDDNLKEVATEGPGSRRVISPLEIGSGELKVNTDEDYIEWMMKTKNKMMEPGINFEEGALNLRLQETIIEDEYDIIISMNYSGMADIDIDGSSRTFKGKYNLVITHTGVFTDDTPRISLAFL